MEADPNWLLSAVAQSTAALVAIVGGLIVSRLIGLSSERNALQRQLRQLQDRRRTLDDEAAKTRQWLVADDARHVEDEWAEALFKTDGAASDADLLAVSSQGGWDPHEYETYLRRVRNIYREAVAAFEALRSRIGDDLYFAMDFDDLVEKSGIEKPPREDADIWEQIWDLWSDREAERERKRLEEQARSVSGSFGSLLSHNLSFGRMGAVRMPIIPRPPSMTSATRRTNKERDYARLTAQLETTDQDIARLSIDLEDVVQPPGLWQGFWVLAVFALVGIGLPVVLMATLPAGLSIAWRTTVVGLFFVGLAGLLAYIAWFARQLRS